MSGAASLFILSDVPGNPLYELGAGEELAGYDSEDGVQGNGYQDAEDTAYLPGDEDDEEYLQGMGLDAVGVDEGLEDIVVDELGNDEYGQDYDQEDEQGHLHSVVDVEDQGHHHGQKVSDEGAEVGNDVEYAGGESHDYGQLRVHLDDEYESQAVECGYEERFEGYADEVAGQQGVDGAGGSADIVLQPVRDDGGEQVRDQTVLHEQEERYEDDGEYGNAEVRYEGGEGHYYVGECVDVDEVTDIVEKIELYPEPGVNRGDGLDDKFVELLQRLIYLGAQSAKAHVVEQMDELSDHRSQQEEEGEAYAHYQRQRKCRGQPSWDVEILDADGGQGLDHRLAYQGYDYGNGYVEQNGAEVPAQEQD